MPAPIHVALHGREMSMGLSAFADGLAARGIGHTWHRPVPGCLQPVPGATHAVVEGLRGYAGELHQNYRAAGVPVFILELPRLRASVRHERKQQADTWALYPDDLHALPRRVGNRAIVWGLLPHHEAREILVCGQKPLDAAHGMDAGQHTAWARDTVALARLQYKKPVVWRPHPLDVHRVTHTSVGADRMSDPGRESLRDAMARAWAVVTYNSTAGVDAIDAGVPVFYSAPAAQVSYADYAAPFGAALRKLTKGERAGCLTRMSALQWTRAQMVSGIAAGCLLLNEPWPVAEIVTVADADALAAERRAVAQAHAEAAERMAAHEAVAA